MTLDASVIEEVRLHSFKSFRQAVLPVGELTLVVGRNGAGKSNALDGLSVLARLAIGEDIRDALDGGREGPAVRGGAAGCAPLGESAFALGVTVATGERRVRLDVTVQVEPTVQVVAETLRLDDEDLLSTLPNEGDSADIRARWGTSSHAPITFRASRLLAAQVLGRIPATTDGQQVHLAAAQVLAALRSVFMLDPVPHLMRQFVPRRDDLLRRDADNLSAAVASLLEDPAAAATLSDALSRLNEQQVVDVTVSPSALDDVMLTLIERFDGHDHQIPARMMSDGTLRFLAILVALMQAPTVDTMPEPLAAEDAAGQTTMMVEELENGLHASQAGLLVGAIRAEVHGRRVRALATAHSPALLDALTGEEHRDVVVCQRDERGRSSLHRLVDLPNYVDVVAGGGLGRSAVTDTLRAQPPATRSASEVLSAILGGERE